MICRTVWITSSFIGFHKWPEAPDEVAYLRNKHRHKFGVRVEAEVSNARDLEFHLLKAHVDGLLNGLEHEPCEDWSCEQIAEYLFTHCEYSLTSVSVDEDGECGATVTLEA